MEESERAALREKYGPTLAEYHDLLKDRERLEWMVEQLAAADLEEPVEVVVFGDGKTMPYTYRFVWEGRFTSTHPNWLDAVDEAMNG